MLRVPGMRSDHVCLTVVLDGKLLLSWGSIFYCAPNHTHIHTPRLLADRQKLETRLRQLFCCCSSAPVYVLILWQPTRHANVYILYLLPTEEHNLTHTHIHTVCETAKTKRARSTAAVVQWLPRALRLEPHVWYSSSSSSSSRCRARKTLLVCGESRVLKSLVVAASSDDRYF